MNTTDIRKNALRIALASVVVFGSAKVLAADGSGTATAEVLTPITITNTASLDFGMFAVGATGGTLTISASTGGRTADGGIVLSSLDAGNKGTFKVDGKASATYSVTGAGPFTLTHATDTTKTMSFTPSYYTAASATGATGTLVNGTDTLSVGGALTVNGSQLAGTYSGNYTVTVEYN